jgi:phosphoglycerate kinase
MSQLPNPVKFAEMRDKTVMFRVDLNAPMQDGKVTDLTRIKRPAAGILALAEHGAKVVVVSHFGRPKGKPSPELSLAPVAEALSQCLRLPVRFVPDLVGDLAASAIKEMQNGEVILLENLRFDPREEANDTTFAEQLVAEVDVYINDAFSCSHREHASISAAARLRPAFAGPLMMAELEALDQVLGNPKRPLAAVVGGAKVSSKLDLLSNLVNQADVLVVGGGMANTFLLADGIEIGASLAEADLLNTAREIKAAAKASGCQLVLPQDGVVATAFAAHAPHRTLRFADSDITSDEMILDAGPDAVAAAMTAITPCQTLIWNGPMGAFELPPFDTATTSLARHVASLSQSGHMISVAGGGDTIAALNHAGVADDFSYVSTAGGAFLEWLEGKPLPGVAVLLTS